MTKIFTIIILFFSSLMVYAQTCPPVEQVFQNGEILTPQGWKYRGDQHVTSNELGFMTAEWGDHSSIATPVMCYYYDKSQMTSMLYVISIQPVHRSHIISNPQWKMVYQDDDYYFQCGDKNGYHDVNSCSF